MPDRLKIIAEIATQKYVWQKKRKNNFTIIVKLFFNFSYTTGMWSKTIVMHQLLVHYYSPTPPIGGVCLKNTLYY